MVMFSEGIERYHWHENKLLVTLPNLFAVHGRNHEIVV